MPIYEYRCQVCPQKFDLYVSSINDGAEQVRCPNCGDNRVRRLVSASVARTGQGKAAETTADSSAPAERSVFGRKELGEALAQRRGLAPE
jgi:putative FmdB family regulatory protein